MSETEHNEKMYRVRDESLIEPRRCIMSGMIKEPIPKTWELLPREQWELKIEFNPTGNLLLILGCWVRDDFRCWGKLAFSDFSKNLTCLDDLESFIVNMVDGRLL